MSKVNYSEYAVVSDFDGTITPEDSTDMLATVLGNDISKQVEDDYIAGRISTRLAMSKHFEQLHISLDEYYAFLDAHIRIDPAFDEFLYFINKKNIPLFIVSGGYREGIARIMGERRWQDVTVYANGLCEEGGLSPVFGHELHEISCEKPIGPCGICKKKCISDIRNEANRKIIYIGDGLTDRCATPEADLLFAKGTLADFCLAENLPFVRFETFSDICKFVKQNDTDGDI